MITKLHEKYLKEPMMFSKLLKAVLIVVCMTLAGCSAFAPHELKANDTIVFFGDSITYFGNQPGGYVTLVREAVAKDSPHQDIQVIGAGISGNKISDLTARVDRDVIAKKPTIVVIYIGINDVWHWRRNGGTTQDAFENGLNELIDKIQAAGGRVILATPTVIGEKKNGANMWDPWLDEYAAITRKVAADRHVPLVDLRALFKSYIEKHNPDNAAQGVLTKDTVHLNPIGDKLVAKQMLKALKE